MQLSLLASTPDIATTGYMVNLLLGTPGLVAAEAKALGYDGIEFFPGPPGTVGVAETDRAFKACDVALTAVNSGRIVAAGLILLHPAPAIRSRALNRLKCSVADAVAWVRRINDPAFGLMLDTHQLHRKEASVTEGLRAAAGYVRHLHLYDPGRVPPGIGGQFCLDWPAIMATLRDIDYEGAASVCLARAGDRLAQASKTLSYLRSAEAS